MKAEGNKQQEERLHPAQHALLVYMRHLSEENWAAGAAWHAEEIEVPLGRG